MVRIMVIRVLYLRLLDKFRVCSLSSDLFGQMFIAHMVFHLDRADSPVVGRLCLTASLPVHFLDPFEAVFEIRSVSFCVPVCGLVLWLFLSSINICGGTTFCLFNSALDSHTFFSIVLFFSPLSWARQFSSCLLFFLFLFYGLLCSFFSCCGFSSERCIRAMMSGFLPLVSLIVVFCFCSALFYSGDLYALSGRGLLRGGSVPFDHLIRLFARPLFLFSARSSTAVQIQDRVILCLAVRPLKAKVT